MSERTHLANLLRIADKDAKCLSEATLDQRLDRVRPFVLDFASAPEHIEQVQVPEFLERRELYLAFPVCAITHDRVDVCEWLMNHVHPGYMGYLADQRPACHMLLVYSALCEATACYVSFR
jgi:hypothetical protein